MTAYQYLDNVDLLGKTVIMRVDFNCPIGRTQDQPSLESTKRIDEHITRTLIPLFKRDKPPRNVVLLAHQGRRGRADYTTLRPHFEYCRSKLMKEQIKVFYTGEELRDDEVLDLGDKAVASDEVLQRILRLRDRTVLLLENVRFMQSEESKRGKVPEDFASDPLIQMLAKVPDRVVALDGFSVAHRPQASVIGLANLGPLLAGPVVLREIEQLSRALDDPKPPMLLIVGGAKVDDSLQSTRRFLSNGMASKVLTGGVVGLVFLLSQGVELNPATLKNVRAATGNLEDVVKSARELLSKFGTEHIKIPSDVAFTSRTGFHRETVPVDRINHRGSNLEAGDIGIETIAEYNCEIAKAGTIVMNGPMGRYEFVTSARGTEEILRYIALAAHEREAHSLVGGGDTCAALGQAQVPYAGDVKESSSGKAFLQVLASGNIESLPGVRALAREGA